MSTIPGTRASAPIAPATASISPITAEDDGDQRVGEESAGTVHPRDDDEQ
jgi:hypothetical protein